MSEYSDRTKGRKLSNDGEIPKYSWRMTKIREFKGHIDLKALS